MKLHYRVPEDGAELEARIAREKSAVQRDRLRAVQLALLGDDAPTIARQLKRSRRFVQHWAYMYRDKGLSAVHATPQTGQPKRLPADLEAAFGQRMLAGPTEADGGLCTLRGKDAQRILEQEFGQKYTLAGAYALLHRLGFSSLKPRPRHRKNDPAAMVKWLQDAPLLSRKSATGTPRKASKSGSRTKPASASRER